MDIVTLSKAIACEIQLNGKKYFFSVIYRSPSQTPLEFENFMNNFELMLSSMQTGNPYSVIITGGFNCISSQCWEHDIENDEGKAFDILATDLGL